MPEAEISRPPPSEIVCNHYKFKSDEEYTYRATRLNKNGFMAGKFDHPIMEGWKRDCNAVPRKEILRFVAPLRQHIASPLATVQARPPFFCAAVAMFRAEETYLEEWLRFYLMQGIDHFFLYDNENNLSRYPYLERYTSLGYVTLIHWPDSVLDCIPPAMQCTQWGGIIGYDKISPQRLALKHCCENYRNSTQWLVNVDVDEYMFLPSGALIADYLRSQSNVAGIEVVRFDFGSNGHRKRPAGLIIENYTLAQAQSRAVKSIAQTRFLAKSQTGNPHGFEYHLGK